MLFSFFITQWYNPTKGDWTEIVKKDLEDFGIPCDFDDIKRKSNDAFKRIVNVKAKEYALRTLRTKQETHTKLDSLVYKEKKMQRYMLSDELKPKKKKLLFKSRTKMLDFGENYKGGRTHVMCPLCKLYLNKQELSYQCPAVKI